MISTSNVVENKEQVLRNIPEIEIFKYYLGINIKEDDYFINPLRNDNTPTCSFSRNKRQRLVLTDWSGWFKGDCFDLVMKLKDCSFSEALHDIWINMSNKTYIWPAPKKSRIGKSQFYVLKHPWDEGALKYWEKYHLDKEILELYDVYPIHKFWKKGGFRSNIRYKWNPEFPGYAYYLGRGYWKIYYPKVGHRAKAFLSNGSIVQGLRQLPNDIPFLVITKSLKDVMVLRKLGVYSIAPGSENALIPEEIMEQFRDITVFTLYDDDPTGIQGSEAMKDKYLTVPLYLNATGKDISDAIEVLGETELKKQLHEGQIFKSSGCDRESRLWREEYENGYRYIQQAYPLFNIVRDSIL